MSYDREQRSGCRLTSTWLRCTAASLFVLVLAAVVAGPAHVQGPRSPQPVYDGPRMKLNLQAPELVVEVPMHFENGDPDTWTLSVVYGASLSGGPRGEPIPELKIARSSGAGAVRNPSLPVLDPELRWRFIGNIDMPVRLVITWTSGGQTRTWEEGDFLSMYTNRGRSHGGNDYTPQPGVQRFPIYTGEGTLKAPQDPYYAHMGKLVRSATSPKTFVSGGRVRRSVVVPYLVPPESADYVQANVTYVTKRGAAYGTIVFAGRSTRSKGKARDVRVNVTTRLTRAGARLAAQLGARRLAAALASRGMIAFNSLSTIHRNEGQTQLWVPMGNCFSDHNSPESRPCSQTCRPFPGMPTGYLIWGALEGVWGSYTCRRGAPLDPEPTG
jgi:hypothetical protein